MISYRALLQYRAAALAGFGTQLFWGFIRVMIFKAFYLSTTDSQPMELDDVITYVWLGQAFLVFIPWNVDREIQALIRSGAVTYELLRPWTCTPPGIAELSRCGRRPRCFDLCRSW